MESNGGSVVDGFSLDGLYQQLKEVDSMDQRVAEMIRTTSWRQSRLVKELKRPGHEGYDSWPSQDDLEEQLEMLSSLKCHLGDFSLSLRKTANILSRPKLRPLTILDMPDEILIDIFGYVKGREPPDRLLDSSPMGQCEVKNLRLTCRRFCNLSSHLLIRLVRVELNSSSLLRLEEISRHPIIRKGVRGVRVLLHFYDSGLANDIWTFADHNAGQLREETELIERSAPSTLLNSSKEMILEAAKKVRPILESWEGFVRGTPDDPACENDLRYRMLLRRAHEEYRRRFADQERLREDGSFIRAVAAAIARMPTAKRLELRDEDFNSTMRRAGYFAQADDNEVLVQDMLLPITWEEARLHGLGQPPAEVLVKLPGAIHKAGALLTGLDIEVSPPEDYAVPAPSEEDCHDLTAAVQKLKTFNFRTRCLKGPSFWPAREPAEVEDLGRFLTALLDTESMEDVRLSFNSLWDSESPPLFSLGYTITLRTWQNLRFLSLDAVPIHLAELERLINQLDRPKIVRIDGMHLLSGSWAEGLDILRRKFTNYSSFNNPSGAECEVLSDEEKEAIFARPPTDRWATTRAERYLLGYIDQNPFRDRTLSNAE
ncbi:hypothetical protein M430DRAFT_267445 [Amorphotheca resinae ATCC 22711]|jgi:hypothetical protein|uniref:F-box domain-containing protein n=1 Tax=Amorphotheca resinae ATCC 22711 TaxID=857342 RepID=A0A2T3AXA9_AMORE|nr:hypothetical protein M430DRAFT_267445 [Amorphotheca resinae ATCC 22711]PSS13293.1 hypothetical protein M430DRAFT_267445 [Amorphotheca resinae ATCC 22711]